MSESALPIDALRGAFEEARGAGPVVITAPTGSGKSTQVPRWCAAASVVAANSSAWLGLGLGLG